MEVDSLEGGCVWGRVPHLSGWPAGKPPPLDTVSARQPPPLPWCSRSPPLQPSWFPFLPGHPPIQHEAVRAHWTRMHPFAHLGAGDSALWGDRDQPFFPWFVGLLAPQKTQQSGHPVPDSICTGLNPLTWPSPFPPPAVYCSVPHNSPIPSSGPAPSSAPPPPLTCPNLRPRPRSRPRPLPKPPRWPTAARRRIRPRPQPPTPHVHGGALTHRPLAAGAAGPHLGLPVQLLPSSQPKRRIPALPGDGTPASGSARLFPDPLGCFRIGAEGPRWWRWWGYCRTVPKAFEWLRGSGPASLSGRASAFPRVLAPRKARRLEICGSLL